MPLDPRTDIKTIDRKMEENKLIMEFVHWLNENKPLPPEYDYMFTVHNRLSLTPVVAVYIIPKAAEKSEEALGGFSVAMPTQWDVVDGIKHLWNEIKTHDSDLRDFIPANNPGH